MGSARTLTEKIIDEHLVGSTEEEIELRIDQILLEDATGTMACLQFERLGVDRVAVPTVSYVDHNTLQFDNRNSEDHAYLRSWAARYGALYSRPGNGISHYLHLERFGRPGHVLLGADSHTTMAGALGMLAIGAGATRRGARHPGPFWQNRIEIPLGHAAKHGRVKNPHIQAGQYQHHDLDSKENIVEGSDRNGIEQKRAGDDHHHEACSGPRQKPPRNLRHRHTSQRQAQKT